MWDALLPVCTVLILIIFMCMLCSVCVCVRVCSAAIVVAGWGHMQMTVPTNPSITNQLPQQ